MEDGMEDIFLIYCRVNACETIIINVKTGNK